LIGKRGGVCRQAGERKLRGGGHVEILVVTGCVAEVSRVRREKRGKGLGRKTGRGLRQNG